MSPTQPHNATTPEEYWEVSKQKMFPKNDCPKKIDDDVKRGLKESEDDQEKWMKLSITLLLLQKCSGG